MGILTDPGATKNLAAKIEKFGDKLGTLAFLAGLVWLVLQPRVLTRARYYPKVRCEILGGDFTLSLLFTCILRGRYHRLKNKGSEFTPYYLARVKYCFIVQIKMGLTPPLEVWVHCPHVSGASFTIKV